MSRNSHLAAVARVRAAWIVHIITHSGGKGTMCLKKSKCALFACAFSLVLMFLAGCKCIELDCRKAPTASLSLSGLTAKAESKSVRIQATTLDIPVVSNVKVCAGYEVMSKDILLDGTALMVSVNDKVALTIDYVNEGGKKVDEKVIDSLLVPGKNKLVIATVTYNGTFNNMEIKTRAGAVVLADGKKVIERCYNPPSTFYAPIAETFTLTAPGNGGGNPDQCPPCHIAQLSQRWVVGVDPQAMGIMANDRATIEKAVTKRVERLAGEDARVIRYSAGGRFAVVTGVEPAKIAKAKEVAGIRFVERDGIAHILDVGGIKHEPIFGTPRVRAIAGNAPNDTGFAKQVYLADINAPAAWQAGHNTLAAKLAVVDTGAAFRLADLDGQVKRGQDFACKRGDQICDNHGHGTHVSGTMIAKTNNNEGVAGVAWNGSLLVNKALDDSGFGNWSDIADAIRYAVDQGAQVISLSLGETRRKGDVPAPLAEVAKYALEKGTVLVCAAGNSSSDNDGETRNYPSSIELPNIIGVLATNTGDRTKANFSSYGPNHVHIAAPGTDIYNLSPTGELVYMSGTSMATPQVAAALAMYWDDLGANLPVQQRVQKFLDTYTIKLPALNTVCEQGRFLQMK